MANNIVTVNVSTVAAPTPSQLQKSGAFVSCGATNTAPGTKSLLTSSASLTSLLKTALALTSITWTTNVATATTTAPHGITIGQTVQLTIAGATAAAYNGTFACTATGTSTFTYPLLVNPGGAASVPGTYIPEDVAELVAKNTTFWAQGSQQGVWVLELGLQDVTDAVSFLSAWIAANPGTFYAYLVSRTWDSNAAYLAFVATFEALTAITYFFTTTTLANYQNYTALMKSVVAMIEAPSLGTWPANALTAISYAAGTNQVTGTTTTAHGVLPGQYFSIAGCAPVQYNGTFLALPGTTGSTLVYTPTSAPGAETTLGTLVAGGTTFAGIPSTEFSLAAPFWKAISQAPSSTNKVTPFAFAFLFGVTAFPAQGNSSLIATLLAANINIVGTGAEGGLSNTILRNGTTMDGNDFLKWWYGIDWAQIQSDQALANAVINGSNNSINPLYYNQDGINRLQSVIASLMNTGIADGIVLGPVVLTNLDQQTFNTNVQNGVYANQTPVNAIPFATYTHANPNDYAAGKYAGLSVAMTPQLGFKQIVFNLNVTNFVAS